MCKRSLQRVAFGKPVAMQGVTQERTLQARCMIEQARLLTLEEAGCGRYGDAKERASAGR